MIPGQKLGQDRSYRVKMRGFGGHHQLEDLKVAQAESKDVSENKSLENFFSNL